MSEPIKSRFDVDVDIHPTLDLGVAIKLKLPNGNEVPAFLSPEQAREAIERLSTAAEEVEKKDV